MRYVVAAVLVAVAFVARQLLDPSLSNRQPFPTFYVSVAAVAWWGGLGPTLFALVLGYIAADWFFVQPHYALSSPDVTNTGMYFFVGLAIAFFTHAMHRAQDRAEQSAAEARDRQQGLEREVAERELVERQREQLLVQLQSARGRLEAVLRQMPAGVVIAEAPSGRIVLANEQTRRIWPRPPAAEADDPDPYVEDLRGKDGRPYMPHEWPLARTLTTGEVIKDEEVVFPSGDGDWGTAFVSSAPVWDPKGAIVAAVAVLYDVTDRKRAEDALRRAHEELEGRVAQRTADLARANESLRAEVAERRLAEAGRNDLMRRLVVVQEEERVRIARELHDQMGQQLTALKLGLESLARRAAGEDGSSPGCLPRLLELTRRIGHDMHRIAWELGPAALDELDLPAALADYAQEWSDGSGVPVRLQRTGRWEGRLAPQVETTVYRVVQEALTNVAKHAAAGRVSLILNRLGDELIVVVEDDGVGFDPDEGRDAVRGDRKLGLVGMRQRVQAVGGALQVESSRGGGTTVFVRVPAGHGVPR